MKRKNGIFLEARGGEVEMLRSSKRSKNNNDTNYN